MSAWWTEADAAELDMLVHELASSYFEHRERCVSCAAAYPPCPHVRRAIEAVIAWRESRSLLSKAEYLREQERRQGVA
jgi:hypothetical protein